MEVCIAHIILKNIGMASEKLYRNTLSTVREVFRGRVGCLEPVFSHDGTSWRVLAQLVANHLAFDKGRGGGGVGRFKKIYPAASQAKKKKFNAWPALTKRIMYAWCIQKRILTNHRQPIPTSSKSESFTYKLCSFIQ